MGEYRDDWFSFEVKSKRHIMDLIIAPSFAKAVCFQVHEMKNDSFQLFWNFGMTSREEFPLLKKFVRLNQIDLKTSMVKVLESKEFNNFMRMNAPPIRFADLDADDMTLINAVVNAEWQEMEYRCGLDGHHYRVKIYGEEIRAFKCWCVIPKAWSELIPLVDRLIEIAKLEPRDCYEVSGVY
ncbi:MAG: hypothetical protein II902_11470 [Selenomonadaceae bacterium]|nr:hypothetical protein [Selenomonadaceae bacterium]